MKTSEKKLNFFLEMDQAIPKEIMQDETRLRQVLFNLVGNAVKFTDAGHIRLSASMGKLAKDSEKFDIVIQIQDTGVGIPNDQLNLIFESFRQQDNQNTTKYGGTGLGLAISKRLIEMMNGHVKVSSKVGLGSLFEITFKDIEVAYSDSSAFSSDITFDIKNIFFEQASVLVVDDLKSNRKMVKEFLSIAGLDIMEAENGEQAILSAEKFSPDLILMDIRMPVMNGLEAFDKLRVNPKTNDIPIIALTASVILEDPEKLKLCRFDGFLAKPITMHKLFNELRPFLKHTEKEHLVKESASRDNSESDVNAYIIENLPELINVLESEMIPIWKELKGALNMDDVEGFARKLSGVAQQYNVASLLEYCRSLLEYVEAFDVEKVGSSLNEFSTICEKVKGI